MIRLSYVRGYSQGAQRAWLERALAASRRDPGIDWVVVCMHQVVISTADKFAEGRRCHHGRHTRSCLAK